MSPLVGCVAPLTRKCPPPPPVPQKSYWDITSPCGSLAVNSDEEAKTCPALAVVFALFTVPAGGVSTVSALPLHVALPVFHCVPSLARTQRVSVPLPL